MLVIILTPPETTPWLDLFGTKVVRERPSPELGRHEFIPIRLIPAKGHPVQDFSLGALSLKRSTMLVHILRTVHDAIVGINLRRKNCIKHKAKPGQKLFDRLDVGVMH